jgi:hypothetical protein
MYFIFTGLLRGRLFCSSMIARTLKGRQRTATPARRAASPMRITAR